MLFRTTTTTMAMAMSTLLLGTFFILGIGKHALVAADQEEEEQQQQGTVAPTSSFEMPEYSCDTGPDALTEFFGKSIPRTCIDVPYNSDDDDDDGNVSTIERCYYTFVPDSCADTAAASSSSPLMLPLVFDIHGLTSCPLYSAGYTGWLEKAQEECFVVVWPTGNIDDDQAVKGCWNLPGFLRDDNDDDDNNVNDITAAPCCCTESVTEMFIPSEEPNDPLFLRMVIDSVVESFENKNNENENEDDEAETETETTTTKIRSEISIDRSRVYMAGHSNGCMASLTMAALHSDVVAAVCCHAGTLLTPFESVSDYSTPSSNTNNYSPVPVWMVHGMKDTTVPFNGSTLLDFAPFGSIGFWSTEDVMNYIANKNDCDEYEVNETVDTTFYKRTNCTNNADVELVALLELGHFPYFISPDSPYFSFLTEEEQGAQDTMIDTTALAWEFCSSYSNSYQQELQQQQQQQLQEEEKETPTLVPTIIIDTTDSSAAADGTGDDHDDEEEDKKEPEGSPTTVVDNNASISPGSPSQAPDDDNADDASSAFASPSRSINQSGIIQAMLVLGVVTMIINK